MLPSTRPIADGLIYHPLNRGNNRNALVTAPADYRAFLRGQAQMQLRYPFRLYAYCLMTNHSHRILEPAAGQSISRILQSLRRLIPGVTRAGTGRSGMSGKVVSKVP